MRPGPGAQFWVGMMNVALFYVAALIGLLFLKWLLGA